MSDDPKFGASLKIEVKTEVPPDASSRLVHAALDTVSPLTEWLGLQGDKVRIYRMTAVDRLLRRASEQLAVENVPTQPIPVKIAVPLLEHASQEDPDDDYMIDAWAALLASAATSSSVSPRFISLLAEMNSRQAALLVALNTHPTMTRQELHSHCKEVIATDKVILTGKPSTDQIMALADVFGPGITEGETASLADARPEDEPVRFMFYVGEPERSIDLEILQSLGLATLVQHEVGISTDLWIDIHCAKITLLGQELLLRTRPKR